MRFLNVTKAKEIKHGVCITEMRSFLTKRYSGRPKSCTCPTDSLQTGSVIKKLHFIATHEASPNAQRAE